MLGILLGLAGALLGEVVLGPAARAHAAEPTVEEATAQLADPDWSDRLSAVYALQRAGRDAAPAAPALVALLADENGLVRMEAAESLGRIGAPAVQLLASGLASRDPVMRLACAVTLGRIGLAAGAAQPALEALAAPAAGDPDPEVRAAATHAVAMIAPRGVAGWARKALFEVRDEPEGPVWVIGAFVALSLLSSLWRAVRWRRKAEERAARPPVLEEPAAEEEAGEEEEEGEDEEEGESADPARAGEVAVSPASPRAASAAWSAASSSGQRPLPGVPHAVAGAVSIGVGGLVLALFGRNPDLEERHATFLFAAMWMLFGLGFVRYGLAGALADRRARRRAATAAEPWLRDRDWRRDGTGPIGAERILPNLVPLVILLALLAPFHTIWRLPLAWWGAWIVLGVLDLLALAMALLLLGRVWSGLRAGRCFLRWSSAPVAPGGRFRGRVESSRTIAATGQAEVKLRCLRDPSGRERGASDPAGDADEVWAETRSFPVHARPEGGSWIDVELAIPADARGTSSLASRPVRWVLAVRVPTSGPDFTTAFPVPVYGRGRGQG